MPGPPADPPGLPPYDAVILAGGRARRLGGVDKPGLLVGERPMVERVAAAVAGAEFLVVAGPPRPGLGDAEFVREDPPGSGPVPALRAAMPWIAAPWLALLAGDLPYVTAAHVDRLREAASDRDGALFVDDGGREQWLAGVWRTTSLRAALEAYTGPSLGGLLRPLDPGRLTSPGDPGPWADCDTPADLAAARARAPGV